MGYWFHYQMMVFGLLQSWRTHSPHIVTSPCTFTSYSIVYSYLHIPQMILGDVIFTSLQSMSNPVRYYVAICLYTSHCDMHWGSAIKFSLEEEHACLTSVVTIIAPFNRVSLCLDLPACEQGTFYIIYSIILPQGSILPN